MHSDMSPEATALIVVVHSTNPPESVAPPQPQPQPDEQTEDKTRNLSENTHNINTDSIYSNYY